MGFDNQQGYQSAQPVAVVPVQPVIYQSAQPAQGGNQYIPPQQQVVIVPVQQAEGGANVTYS